MRVTAEDVLYRMWKKQMFDRDALRKLAKELVLDHYGKHSDLSEDELRREETLAWNQVIQTMGLSWADMNPDVRTEWNLSVEDQTLICPICNQRINPNSTQRECAISISSEQGMPLFWDIQVVHSDCAKGEIAENSDLIATAEDWGVAIYLAIPS